MWMRPHLLVLDEPTNYLDREALGALTLGIKEFGGGVIIISHNSEFINAITTETWLLEGGRLQTIGGAQEVRWGGGLRETVLVAVPVCEQFRSSDCMNIFAQPMR